MAMKPLFLNVYALVLQGFRPGLMLRPRSILRGGAHFMRVQRGVVHITCGAVMLLLIASCDKPVSTVILDSGDTAEQAKATCDNAQAMLDKNAGMISQLTCGHITSCVEQTAIVAACGTDIAGAVRALETDIASEMTGNAKCKGIHFIQTNEAAESKKTQQPHWALSLHFAPGKDRHAWDMVRSTDNVSVHGEGGAGDIAQRICALATGTESPK